MDPALDHDAQLQAFEGMLRTLIPKLPGAVRFRMENTFDHFDRAFALLPVDRAMASFRAITGQEEAATALMKAIQLRRYPFADQFNARNHEHKAAVLACVIAIGVSAQPILREFQATLDLERKRIDVKIPLSNFGVANGENYAVQPVEPLDFIYSREGVDEPNLFDRELDKLAVGGDFANVKNMVATQANARNTLLYASDAALPKSQATMEGLKNRKQRATALLMLTVMVLQSRKQLALVKHAISAFLKVISKLPAPPANGSA